MTMDDVQHEIISEEVQARKDALVADTPAEDYFLSWLRRQTKPELNELQAVVLGEHFKGRRWLSYNYEKFCMKLIEIGREDLMESLLHAEADWNLDKMAAKAAKAGLGIDLRREEFPIAVVQCGFMEGKQRGQERVQCELMSLPGATRCAKHGGDWLDPRIRQSLLLNSYARLVEASDIAADALIDVALNGKREDARVMAAREILDRAGIRGGSELTIKLFDQREGESQVSQLEEKLNKMAEGLIAAQRIDAATEVKEGDIVDAEVIEDSDHGSVDS